MIRRNGCSAGETRDGYRVVLLGGKELAIRCLEEMLLMPEVDVVAVIPCAGDVGEAGTRFPSLARYAAMRGLPVHQPKSVNEGGFLPVLQQLRPDLLLSVFYDKILRPRVLKTASLVAANLHFGLLPYNRGSFPIPWAMIDGNDPGVTFHVMDPGVDTGDIIAQMAVPVSGAETAGETYDRCTAAGFYLFQQYLRLLLRGRAPLRPQEKKGGTYYRPGYPYDRWIDWSQSAEQLCRFVRALTFPPFPSARSAFKGRELEVCHPAWATPAEEGWPNGTVIEVKSRWVRVATANGLLGFRDMKLDGMELPAGEVLQRVGCSEGEALDSVTWMKSEAA